MNQHMMIPKPSLMEYTKRPKGKNITITPEERFLASLKKRQNEGGSESRTKKLDDPMDFYD